ncbi:MAG: septum formation protein Maf [Wenzhouxiangella sp.]|nr:MAG: septum formation protein Maf [Wenzhouxiangella sp.]
MPRLILASGSVYRRQMLARLGIPFEVMAADIDETARPDEGGQALAQRLSLEKANKVAAMDRDAVVIGADQVAECRGRLLGKPGTIERAREQLAFVSGHTVVFHSAMAMVSGERCLQAVVPTTLRMRQLTEQRIAAYVERDKPLDCAGAMRSESLGVALVDAMASDDATALIGLPLIRCVQMLESFGIDCLESQ